jgi:flagellar hook-associated protein 3 FlgL
MFIRTTNALMVSRASTAIQRHTARIANSQEQLVTGLRVNRPSDDPLAARSILGYRALETQLESRLRNITDARAKLDSSVSQILAAKDVLIQAKNIALESPQSFELDELATQVSHMRERLVQIANSQLGSQYLFSGTAVSTRPFSPDSSAFSELEYSGSNDPYRFHLEQDIPIELYMTGKEVFQPRDRGATVFVGNTGAAAGTGTDTGVGRAVLQVRHATTTYAGASGVQAGTDSAALDTIIGPSGAHTLTINDTSGTGASGTIALNGGNAYNFTSGDTNLKITGPDGAVVYVDTTAITAGFNGTVDIAATGTLSTDGGVTSAAIDFSANQKLTDSLTDSITYVNSTLIRQTGDAHLEYSGTQDVFGVLKALEDDLLNTRDLSTGDRQAATSRIIGDLDRVIDHLINIAGEQAATLENLDALETRYDDVRLETRRLKTETESADPADVLIKLQTDQNLLQFAYSTTAQLFNLNILNYL